MSKHSETIAIASIAGFDRKTINGSLRPQRNTANLALIGSPRGTYGKDCADPQNPKIIALLETADFGPFRATGLRPAVAVLQAIMADVAVEQPDIHHRLTTAGMLCCRLVRDSSTAISNHSWGTAIDLKIDGMLDTRGDNRVQRGLLDLRPIFNRHGFFWGIAFSTEDAMHFEASAQLIQKWADQGAFGPQSANKVPRALTIGDRGPQVLTLQQALNRALAPLRIDEDGIFGKDTRAAVFTLQHNRGLAPDGTGSATVLKALGLR